MREAEAAASVRSDSARVPGVVLLHGIARTSRSLSKLERGLQAAGFATLNIDYPSRKKTIAALADEIHPAILRFSDARDAPLHFVGYSIGGLVVRAYVAKYRPSRLGHVVTLGTPHGGSEVADLLKGSALYRSFYGPAGLELTTGRAGFLPVPDYPVGTIAGNRFIDPVAGLFVLPRPNDGRVSVQSAMVQGMADHIVIKASHTGLPSHVVAIAQTIAFLREGRFYELDRGIPARSQTE